MTARRIHPDHTIVARDDRASSRTSEGRVGESGRADRPPGHRGREDVAALRDFWYCALPSHRLRGARTVACMLLGEPVLLGRGRDGTPFALRNVCPHRGMPLSCGRFDGEEIECCYHGWRFDRTGQCTAIPSLVAGQPLDLARIRVHRYPCREMHGLIWVFCGEDEAGAPGIPPLPGIGERGPDLVETIRCPVPADHAIIGLIDPAHGPFVHRSPFWRPHGSLHEKVKRFEPSPWGFSMVPHAPSTNSRAYRLLGGSLQTGIEFRLPGVRIEHVQAGHHQLINLTAVTPIDDASSEVINALYWTMPWLTIAKPMLRAFTRRFLRQDLVAFSRLREGLPNASRPMMIKDADTQVRWYLQLKAEYQSARAEGREFVNPVTAAELRWRT